MTCFVVRAPIRHALAALAGLALGLTATVADAHPDVAVTARVLFDFKDARMVGLMESFTFDATESARMIRAYDSNRDGRFDADETAAMAGVLGADFGRYQFFTQLTASDGVHVLRRPVAFTADIENGLVTVAFAFTLAEPLVVDAERPVEVMLRDADYTIDFRFADDRPAMVRGAERECEATTRERPDAAVLVGRIVPWALTLTCR